MIKCIYKAHFKHQSGGSVNYGNITFVTKCFKNQNRIRCGMIVLLFY